MNDAVVVESIQELHERNNRRDLTARAKTGRIPQLQR
jgi:hypothetical protein